MTTALQHHHGAAMQHRAAGEVGTDGLTPCEELCAGDKVTVREVMKIKVRVEMEIADVSKAVSQGDRHSQEDVPSTPQLVTSREVNDMSMNAGGIQVPP